MHNLPIEVEAGYLRQLDPNVLVLADHVTYRRRNLPGGIIPVATWYSRGWNK